MRLVFALIAVAGCNGLRPNQQQQPVVKCPEFPTPPVPPEIGRYQIVQGTVQVGYKTGLVEEPVVLRIDTVTGKVSRYVRWVDKKTDKLDEFWTVPIE